MQFDSINPMNDLTSQQKKICKKCGECCKWITFTVTFPTDLSSKYYEYYSVHGCRVFANPEGSGEVRGMQYLTIMVPSICKHLKEKVGCKIYERRPKFCHEYDARRDPLIKCPVR